MATHTPSRAGERGVILMTAVLFAMTILAFSASVITSGVAASNQKRYLIAKQRALGAAESGVYHLLAGLNGPLRVSLLAAGKLEATLQGKAGSKRALRYSITFKSSSILEVPIVWVPLNIMCSKRWATPVTPGRSLTEPTLATQPQATLGSPFF